MNQSLAFAITMTAISALLLFCWIMEMRTVQKLREEHQHRMFKLQTEHANAMDTLRLQHEADLERERSESWKEGVRMGSEATRQRRDKAGRFA